MRTVPFPCPTVDCSGMINIYPDGSQFGCYTCGKYPEVQRSALALFYLGFISGAGAKEAQINEALFEDPENFIFKLMKQVN